MSYQRHRHRLVHLDRITESIWYLMFGFFLNLLAISRAIRFIYSNEFQLSSFIIIYLCEHLCLKAEPVRFHPGLATYVPDNVRVCVNVGLLFKESQLIYS